MTEHRLETLAQQLRRHRSAAIMSASLLACSLSAGSAFLPKQSRTSS
jgi:hypothetical protein